MAPTDIISPRRAITTKKVAKRAGLSISAFSRALTAGASVAPATRSGIVKAAEIDLTALYEIEAVTTVPLVLYGGSCIPSAMRCNLAATSHVKKFNIGTELRMSFGASLRAPLLAQPDEFDRIKLL